jgi:hypothetical protein
MVADQTCIQIHYNNSAAQCFFLDETNSIELNHDELDRDPITFQNTTIKQVGFWVNRTYNDVPQLVPIMRRPLLGTWTPHFLCDQDELK